LSVEQPHVVDIISTDTKTGHVVLAISDHLDWSNSVEHQTTLQAKFNKYLAFIESGELLTRYPGARNRPVAIKVWFRCTPDEEGQRFLARAKEVIEATGLSPRYEVSAESQTPD